MGYNSTPGATGDAPDGGVYDSQTSPTEQVAGLTLLNKTAIAAENALNSQEAAKASEVSALASSLSALASKNSAEASADAAESSNLLANQALNQTIVAADNASNSASASAISAEQAETSSTLAGQHEATALDYVTTAGTYVQLSGINSTAAATSATNAATSATNAATSESNAATSEANAANSASSAATSATNAATSESNADTSKSNAATSASNAATSAANAATSESNAATSATNAATSESSAETYASNAASSAEAIAAIELIAAENAELASTSASNAATSENNAETSESNAATSANAAAVSASAALASSNSASTSAGTAASDASTASTAAANALTSASNAFTSASNAATSESNAATSANSASTNAINAASSASNALASEGTALSASNSALASSASASQSAYNAQQSSASASTSAAAALVSETNANTSNIQSTNSAVNSEISAQASAASAFASAQSAAASALSAESAALSYDQFDDRYLGPKEEEPTLDNDGDALLEGALYWNSTTKKMYVYNGTIWEGTAITLSVFDTDDLSEGTANKYYLTSRATEDVGAVTLDMTGFVNRTDSTLSFNTVTRVLTLTPTTTTVIYYRGKKYEVSSPLSITITNTSGGRYVYFNPTTEALAEGNIGDYGGIITNALVSYVYWDSVAQKALIFGDERHSAHRDTQWHLSKHIEQGSVWRSGGNASYTLLNEANISLAFSNPISIADEDVVHSIAHSATPSLPYQQVLEGAAVIPTVYLSGTTYVQTTASTVPWVAGTALARYNPVSGGVGSLVDVTNNNYMSYWIVATNDSVYPVKAIMGHNQSNKIEDIEAETFGDYGLPVPELVPMYHVILRVDTAYTQNTPHVAIAAVYRLTGREVSTATAFSATSHSALTGRGAEDQHPISAITNLQSTLDTEASTRASADTALQTAIDAEATARATAISDEASARSSGDTNTLTSANDYTDSAISSLVDTAPTTLNTLNELAAALGDDANFATTVSTNIGLKADKSTTISAGTGLSGGGSLASNRTISHADSTVTAGTYGSSTSIPSITVDARGHVTAASGNSISVGDGSFTVNTSTGLSGGGQLGTANQAYATSLTLTNTDRGSQQNIFKNIAVSGQPTVIADNNNDTLTFVAGSNISLTTDPAADSLTINANIPTYSLATSTVAGIVKLESDVDQTITANPISAAIGRTYGIQLNELDQMVVNVPWSNTTYNIATSTVAGIVELFSDTDQSIAANAVTATAGRTYGIQLNSDNQMVVNVPWSNTTYNIATANIPGLVELFSDADQSVPANPISAAGSRTYGIQLNSANQMVVNVPWVDTDTTYSQATASTLGLIKLEDDTVQTVAANAVTATSGRTYGVQVNNSGQAVVNVPWSDTNTDTNNYVTSAAFDTGTGVLTLNRSGLTAVTVDLDGKYAESSHTHSYVSEGGTTFSGEYPVTARTAANTIYSHSGILFRGSDSRLTVSGLIYASGTQRVFADNYHPNADKWTTARTNTVTLTGDVTGSGNASVDGSGNWTVSVATTVGDNSHNHSIDSISDEHRLFNNMGANHNTTTNFNSVPNFGARYVQAGTNGPTGVGSHQFYGFTLGLGNEYSISQYASQLYWARQAQSGGTYLWARDLESGTWGSWRKMSAGYADSAGSASTADYATTAGSADQIDGWGFVNTGSNSAVNADTINSNGISYYTAGVTNFSGNSTDGALYSQRYSDSWQHQIAGDYRSGQIALRGKNNGTWQAWRTVVDSSNVGTYAALPGHSHSNYVTTTYNSSLNSDSRNSRGVTRLYRRDDNSDYSVQTYWTGSYWRLYGYYGDSGHADVQVGYADSAGYASSAGSAGNATTLNSKASSAFHQRIHYGTTAGNSGYYKIKILPATSWMMSFIIRVYQSYGSFDIRVSGYNYGGNYWYSPEASLIDGSSTSIEVRFGYDSAYNLWVAIPAASYTGLDVVSVVNGYTQVDGDYADQFSITHQTSLTGTTQTTVTAYRPLKYNENAVTATTLQTARTINGVSFNGSANITVADSTKLPLTGGTTTGTINAPTFNATSTTSGGFQGIDADTVSSPSFTWTADLNTGIWRPGTDIVGITAGGNDEFRVYTSYTIAYGSSRAPIFYDSNNTAYYADLSSTGTSINAAGSIVAASDIRLKDNIETIPNALEKTLKLRGVTYTRKDGDNKTRQVGVIAQEVKEVLPEAVVDGAHLSVAYGNMVGLLIEAIKEQQKQIEELKSKLI